MASSVVPAKPSATCDVNAVVQSPSRSCAVAVILGAIVVSLFLDSALAKWISINTRFMGASFRLRLGGEKLNRIRLAAPAFPPSKPLVAGGFFD